MNSTDFTLTYQLKAHTPMIHFQAKQLGATLRASEVKPKLDKFIVRKLGKENIPEDWFVRGSTTALNYKLHFRALGMGEIGEPHKMFFGNSSKRPNDPDFTNSLKGPCTMRVLCFIPKLREAIDDYIEEFFICSSFGRMQSKGFGSFTVVQRQYTKEQIGAMLCESTGATTCYCFPAANYNMATMNRIQLLYSVMKGGFNRTNHAQPQPEQYHRSYLFEYFHNQDIGNEKAALKKNGISPALVHPENKKDFGEDPQNYQYVRALLGVAEGLEYSIAFTERTNAQGVPYLVPSGIKTDKHHISISSDVVNRFASPIYFKIIDDTVYMAANRIDPLILGQKFTFTNQTTRESMELCVPEQFDIDDFMAWFVQQYNTETSELDPEARITYSIRVRIDIAFTTEGGGING